MMKKNSPPLHYVIDLLSRRDYSEYKIRKKLSDRDYDQLEIDEVIAIIKEKNYLREDYYIEARVKYFMKKNYSPFYIQQKLKAEFLEVSFEVIGDIFDEYQFTENEQIKSLIQKKIRSSKIQKDQSKIKQKILSFLQSKGHSLHKSNTIYSQVVSECS